MKIFAKFAPLLLVVAALASAWQLNRRWNTEPFLRGADAYYYALQANYWAQTGAVKIPDSSVLHRITGSLQRAGWTSEQAVRLWESASLFLFFILLLGLAWLPQRELSWSSALLLAYTLFSPSLLFLALEFPKFFTVLLAVPLWFYPLLGGRPLRWLALGLAWASCLLHRGALPLAACFSLGLLLASRRDRLPLGNKWTWAVGFTAIATLIAAPWLADRFHLIDLKRLSWEAPQPGILTLVTRHHLPLGIKVESLVSLAIVAATFRRLSWPALTLFLPALFPFGSTEVFGAGERYAILVPALALIALVERRSERTAVSPWLPWQAAGVVLTSTLLPFLPGTRTELAHPRGIDPDFAAYASVTAELQERNIPMLIAPKGLVFFYKFKLMREAFPYEPEAHWDKTRIWRAAARISADEFHYFVPQGCGFETGLLRGLTTPGFTLVREDCWARFRAAVPESVDPDLYARVWEPSLNPSRHRPAFLYPKHAEDKDAEFPALPPHP